MESFPAFLEYILIAVLILAAAPFVHWGLSGLHPPKKAKTVTTFASVFSKATNNGHHRSAYFIAFLLPDGTRQNMQVSIEEYNTVREGEHGVLTYKEHKSNVWFVDFSPNASN